eukprot:2359743-Prymnesium_polylepis.1
MNGLQAVAWAAGAAKATLQVAFVQADTVCVHSRAVRYHTAVKSHVRPGACLRGGARWCAQGGAGG